MAGSFLLDTNLFVAYFNDEQGVIDRILAADAIVASITALGELHYGAAASQKPEVNRVKILALETWVQVAACDEQTAAIYGMIKRSVRTKGRLIPDNDIWIAASAVQLDLPLVSRDEHFRHVDNLDWQVW